MSELKANEFRIGTFVLDKDKKVRTVYSVLENALIIGQNQFIGTPIEWCEPIKLTEHIINDSKNTIFNNGYEYKITTTGRFEIYLGISLVTVIEFVHEYQNLNFALLGEELVFHYAF